MGGINLSTPLPEIPGVPPRFLPKLKRLGIATVRDLLWHFPTRYEDFSQIYKIADLIPGQDTTVQGVVKDVSSRRTWRRRLYLVEAVISDGSGSIRAVWFNQPYIRNTLKPGRLANFSGKVTENEEGALYLSNPTYELITYNLQQTTKHTARIVPIYPETRGLTSKGLRYLIKPLLNEVSVEEPLPPDVLRNKGFPEVNAALQNIHFPEDVSDALAAKKRFAFEDLLFLQLYNIRERLRLLKEHAPAIATDIPHVKKLIEELPFALTLTQKAALWEILQDLAKPHPMNRLLQGDVGSGKTAVAAIAALAAAREKHQTAFMAPTELLAHQHYHTFRKLFGGFEGGVALLTSSEARAAYGHGLETEMKKAELQRAIADSRIAITIGTHALIEKTVSFPRLALVVVDEQHRFGVRQRAALLSDTKNTNAPELHETDRIVEKELSYKLNGIFFEIQKESGRFLRERQYADILEQKLKLSRIPYRREFPAEIGGRKSNFADFVIENKILIELKTKPFFEKGDYYQTLRCLESFDLQIGLLVNFGQKFLKPKRILNPKFESFGCHSSTSCRVIPHFLSTSATPIPRTLSLTIFGDLDLSLITELPKDRKPIITKVVSAENRAKAYQFIRDQVRRGRQVFVICPRIEPTTSDERPTMRALGILEMKTVKEEFEKLSKKVFPDLRVEMLHGRMKSKEKETIMHSFLARECDILVATSVVEVGVDVPNASVMMIESAERFGLAQLYQFRGRVGRGTHQSFCFLFTEADGKTVQQRLKAVAEAKNGFELAEKDLKFRGPGEFLGETQSGMPDLAMKAVQNPEFVKRARDAAVEILERDAALKEHPALRERLAAFESRVHRE